MRVLGIIVFSVLFCNLVTAQEEASFWYFGDYAGLDFSNSVPVVLSNSGMFAEAGCTSISNKNGMLQFYTNGGEVWNKDNQLMPNGTGLNGSQVLNQNSLVVPVPGSDYIYYLFTINAKFDSVGLNYSIVDMQLNGGLGDVQVKNKFLYKGLIEKLTGARHCNGEDIWVVSHNRLDGYFSFLLSADSLAKTPVESFTGNKIKSDIGYLKMSPASNRIAMPINSSSLLVELSRFHNRSGKVFDPVRIFPRDSAIYAYGIEFSPDGNKLYISTGGLEYKLWQYDLTVETEEAINQSAELIATGNHFAMQLAPDGKIYIAKENRDYLSAILSPNLQGLSCNYSEYEINLQDGMSLMGLPNFLPFYFYDPQILANGKCLGDTTQFIFPQYQNSDSLSWDFGDGSPKVTTGPKSSIKHFYQDPSTYLLELLVFHCGIIDTVSKSVSISLPPEVNLGNDTIICNSCSITLDGGDGMDYCIWQDGSESQFFQVWDEGLYQITVWKNDCITTDSIYISKGGVNAYLPTAFTPNGDGINDYFKPVSSEPLSEYQLIIFDRWGEVVFESTDFEQGWDGRFKGEFVVTNVYSWKVVYTVYNNKGSERVEKLGTVTLIR
jgi:gliding motility-associated-like protein